MAPSRPSKTPAEDSALIRAYFDKRESLLLFLASRTRSMSTAEDLVQDLYLKLLSHDADADVRAPSALLYRMAANLLIDHARSNQRSARRNGQWRTETRAALGGEDVVDEPAADEVLVAKQRVRQLAEAVAALPPQMGRAFRLHKLEGLSQAQTAQAMGISTKMIEQHIQAAVRHLTQRLRS
ncbi:MAG TPA: RNA polymerase sigma factor [Phenylobacterium sp.]